MTFRTKDDECDYRDGQAAALGRFATILCLLGLVVIYVAERDGPNLDVPFFLCLGFLTVIALRRD